MICKPVGLGSSIGVRAAKDRAGFLSAYREARRHGRVLIEKLLPLAAELEVAYLDVDGGIFTPPGRVRAAGL